MNNRMLTVVGMFVVSVFIGRQMFATTEVIQAQPVMPSIVELPNFPKVIKEEKKSVDEIDVEVDLSTLEVSVKGTTDAKVNVKTTGEPKPVVKWKTKVIEKTVTDWINEIFSIIQPTAILRGLGRAVYLYTSQTGSPCMAHSIMHTHMSKAGWSEEQVAEALRALIGENFRYKLKDDPEAKPEEDKAINAITGLLGNDYIDKLFADYTITTDGVEDSKKTELEAAREVARKVLGSIRTNYFDKQKETPTLDKMRMVVGQIINLYRDPADRLAEYCQGDLIAPKEDEYPKNEEKSEGTEKKN